MKTKILLPLLALLCLLPALARAQNALTYTTNNGAITITGYVGSRSDVTNVVIPATLNGYPVTSIETNAFQHCYYLTNVVIGNSVTSIGDHAFESCYDALTSVVIGNSVTSIGNSAFRFCLVLTSVVIPSSVTSIGDHAFANCPGLTNVVIGNSVTSIGYWAFANCIALTSVVIPNSVTSIGFAAFIECHKLRSAAIGNSVTSIGGYAFYNCSGLTNITFLGNAPALGDDVFLGVEGAKVYYYYGTTGWGATYRGLPTVMLYWPPQIGGGGGNVGVLSGNFGFTISGGVNQTVVVEASTNLVHWQPVWTNTLSGVATNFTDPQWQSYPARFYRAR